MVLTSFYNGLNRSIWKGALRSVVEKKTEQKEKFFDVCSKAFHKHFFFLEGMNNQELNS